MTGHEYKRLQHLLHAYLHPDMDLEFGSVERTVDAFLRDYGTAEVSREIGEFFHDLPGESDRETWFDAEPNQVNIRHAWDSFSQFLNAVMDAISSGAPMKAGPREASRRRSRHSARPSGS